MMGAASPPPSRRLSYCSVFDHSYDPRFSPPILFYMNAPSDEGYPLSANSSSSDNLKQTSMKLLQIEDRPERNWVGRRDSEKDIDFDFVSGSGSEVLRNAVLLSVPLNYGSVVPENPSCLHPNPVQVGSDTCNQRVLTPIGAYTVLTFNGTDWKKIYWTEL